MKINPLTTALLEKKIAKPELLCDPHHIAFVEHKPSKTPDDVQALFPHTQDLPYLKFKPGHEKKISPLTVGVVFSGGQAPGGHNVIWGLHETLIKLNPQSKLIGFLNGPRGILEETYTHITKKELDLHRNLGGFNMIGSGRTKISTQEQLSQALKVSNHLQLDGLVIIGGDDSNTNAALLAEYFQKNGSKTSVVGVPKTIDGDLQNDYIEVSFGYDTACKLYSELVGNILVDALSAKKYYHFIKLMGRSASHIALECALQTHPNMVLIGEEVQSKNQTLLEIVDQITEMVIERAKKNKHYGVILIPEGLIDFIPSFRKLNAELNDLLAEKGSLKPQEAIDNLSDEPAHFFKTLPEQIQKQLLLDRDPHGNIQLAKIETNKLLAQMVQNKLAKLNSDIPFSPQTHYFGYEGRCSNPTCFDAEYTFALGATAALLIRFKKTGYMASIKGLNNPAKEWQLYGLPINSLMNIEHRHGKDKPVIKKALVDLKGNHFKKLQTLRADWLYNDEYNAPGPIQYFGVDKITHSRSHFLDLL